MNRTKKEHEASRQTDRFNGKSDCRKGGLMHKALELWNYFLVGVWSDTRTGCRIGLLKTLSLSVKSFLNRDIQTQACALTYRTMLAVVPALALLFAIGRGFGAQAVLKDQLLGFFPAQQVAINYALNFVDSYLEQSKSGGVFVGVGIVFLLWTLISLVSNVENKFNMIWGVKQGRNFWRKITDYTAMFLILPILLICVSGINIVLSSTLDAIFDFRFLTPVISLLLEVASWLLTWLFFTAVYMLIPNTKVKFKNAFAAGIVAGTCFLALQWLFVTGTLYVTRYNAIYGSFSFVPLMLLWVQLVWVICMAGAVICYSSQNIFRFSFEREIATISTSYSFKVSLAIVSVIVHRFVEQKSPMTSQELVERYNLPTRLVTEFVDKLCLAGILSRVVIDEKEEIYGLQPAIAPEQLTVAVVADKLENQCSGEFIPGFDESFSEVDKVVDKLYAQMSGTAKDICLAKFAINDIE